MINKDKFGKIIYKKVFERLLIKGEILSINGYYESKNNPNLFYKKIPEGMFFADMRGTDMVPIWEDMEPLFYWSFNEEVPLWKRRRTISSEFTRLSKDGCHCRLANEIDTDTTKELDCTFSLDSAYAGIHWLGGDGYCCVCKRDIQSDDMFCSEKCKNIYEDELKITCVVCKERYEKEQIVEHHTCYDPEITITVCRKCHNIIHKSERLPHLKPPIKLPAS